MVLEMTEPLSIVLVLFGAIVNASAAFFVKKGIDHFPLLKLYKSNFFLFGFFLYLSSIFIYLVALRGGELSVLYPLVSTTYIWSMFFSVRYLDEKMNKWKWRALIGIIIGVIFIGFGS
jgi:undecaprenyl phosphate-alpha-L-ara4N flippase subunit ArnE